MRTSASVAGTYIISLHGRIWVRQASSGCAVVVYHDASRVNLFERGNSGSVGCRRTCSNGVARCCSSYDGGTSLPGTEVTVQVTLTFVFIKGAPGLFITDYCTHDYTQENSQPSTPKGNKAHLSSTDRIAASRPTSRPSGGDRERVRRDTHLPPAAPLRSSSFTAQRSSS